VYIRKRDSEVRGSFEEGIFEEGGVRNEALDLWSLATEGTQE
jgi:hypothetical protein